MPQSGDSDRTPSIELFMKIKSRIAGEPEEYLWSGLKNRILQQIARMTPGARTLRVWLHRARGVKIGPNSWIGYDVVLETSCPYLVEIGERTSISMRATVIAHFKELRGVRIGRDVFIGPGAIILPGVTIGDGAVVTAGSVVTASVPPATMVRGNPAAPIAKCGVPLRDEVSYLQFAGSLKPIPPSREPRP